MKKKVVCMVLCIAMCFSLIVVPVSAAGNRDTSFQEALAIDLKNLELFKGTTETGTNFELNRPATRIEAIVMLIRVLGKEKEALTGSWHHPFTDVASWADPYIGYAFETGLTNGSGPTTFGNGDATAAMYITFMLRALGYSDADGTDFTWDNPYLLAKSVGILPEQVDTSAFWRADAVTVSYAALNACLKDGNQTLAQKLIDAGAFTKAQYDMYYDIDAINDNAKGESEDVPLKFHVKWTESNYEWYPPFVNGFSKVWNNGTKFSYYALVNAQGKEVLPLSENNQTVSNFQDGLAFVSQYVSAFESKEFFINENGKIVIDPEKLGYCFAEPFYDGLAQVRKGKSMWQETTISYIDYTGKEVISLDKEYYGASEFSEGHAFIRSSDGVKIIDKKGKVTGSLPKGFDFTDLVSEFHEGYAKVDNYYDENGNHLPENNFDIYYFTDTHGNILNKTGYENAGNFSEGLAAVTKDGKCGYIDTAGNIAIPFIWDGGGHYINGTTIVHEVVIGSEFVDGYAMVQQNGKYVFIDRTGTIVSEPKDYKYFEQVEDGYWRVSDSSGYLWGLIDNKGGEVLPLEYERVEYSDGLILAKKDGRCGYMDTSGKVVIPFYYDDATVISGGLAWVKLNGRWGILHLDTTSE